ncbi:4Fe-4S cluster-binding domain-containing protein [Blautia marasmi]|uniref:4Fe-4S cluster-binding domain-containing protein n=1 Tax=Blautia marasmi TaxID=1917868 RepID=UPI000CF1F278|nr:4Fe-4S cluster-binding domain-containing protein [Blautia marasmi]
MLVTNIQRFSLHDGPGIRTTVFLKGCSLRCPWCSNPENIKPYPEKYYKDGVEGIYGKNYTCDEIYDEIVKDRIFYEENGGVTFSGGEALLYVDELLPLLEKLEKESITIAVETCLFVPIEKLECIIPYIDYFYVDMKILDKCRCRSVTEGNLDLYKANFDLLTFQKMITVRIPVIGHYTDDIENKFAIIDAIKKYEKSILKIELIKGHNLSEIKYESLGIPSPQYYEVSDASLIQYKEMIEKVVKVPVHICKI